VLTTEDRTDGYAGLFVVSVLEATDIGKKVLAAGTTLADEPARTLESLVEPLIASEPAQPKDLRAAFEAKFGDLPKERLERIAAEMARETEALSRLCDNLKAYSHYKRVRFYILGLLAWLMSYLLKAAAQDWTPSPVLFFDFSGSRESRTRLQSKTSYARLREMVGQSYFEFSRANRFTSDP
jgi:hypothetical protein